MRRLLLILLAFLLVELVILIELGGEIGSLAVAGIIVGTGILGLFVIRRHGLSVVRQVRRESRSGETPADALIDGFLVFTAGALLLLPGVIADLMGLMLLIGPIRRAVRRRMRRGTTFVVRRRTATPPPGRPPEPPPPGAGKVIDQEDVA